MFADTQGANQVSERASERENDKPHIEINTSQPSTQVCVYVCKEDEDDESVEEKKKEIKRSTNFGQMIVKYINIMHRMPSAHTVPIKRMLLHNIESCQLLVICIQTCSMLFVHFGCIRQQMYASRPYGNVCETAVSIIFTYLFIKCDSKAYYLMLVIVSICII